MRAPLAHALLLSSLTACGPERFEPAWGDAEPPPNVLIITIDTLRADHLGLYGYPRDVSPELDRLAESAVVFDRAIASASWTLPGLASVFTSLYSSTHHCWSFGSRLDDSFLTLPEILTDAGYDSACVVSHLFCTTRHGLQQGFVHFDDSYAYPEVAPEEHVSSPVIAEGGLRFLRQKSASADGQPWFLWLHFFDPHANYLEHDGLSERFRSTQGVDANQVEIDLYDGEIALTDRHVGRVLDALDELGFADDTLVCVLADHGEEFLDHGGRRHGHTLFSELVHVPLILRAPGLTPRRVRTTVSTVSVMPTLLELVGLPVPGGLEGVSLAPLLREENAEIPEVPALAEIRLDPRATMDCIVEGRFKLVRHLDEEGSTFLYDLDADPREQADVSEKHPAVAHRLAETLRERVKRAGEKARSYSIPDDVGLSPSVLEGLRDLGYVDSE